MRFRNILMSRDLLGHPLSLNYKGYESFPTKLGAYISIAIQGIVLAYFARKLIALFAMTDP